MVKLTKKQAAEAVSRTAHLLYESLMIREAAASIQENHGTADCQSAHEHFEVLRAVAAEKSDEAFDVISHVDAYFIAELKPKVKKLAVVKTAKSA